MSSKKCRDAEEAQYVLTIISRAEVNLVHFGLLFDSVNEFTNAECAIPLILLTVGISQTVKGTKSVILPKKLRFCEETSEHQKHLQEIPWVTRYDKKLKIYARIRRLIVY